MIYRDAGLPLEAIAELLAADGASASAVLRAPSARGQRGDQVPAQVNSSTSFHGCSAIHG